MAATSERWASESSISSSWRVKRRNAARFVRYASRYMASPATAYWRDARSSEAITAASERLACVTFTDEWTACSARRDRRSKAMAFVNSANNRGAATIEKPIRSSDRNDRG